MNVYTFEYDDFVCTIKGIDGNILNHRHPTTKGLSQSNNFNTLFCGNSTSHVYDDDDDEDNNDNEDPHDSDPDSKDHPHYHLKGNTTKSSSFSSILPIPIPSSSSTASYTRMADTLSVEVFHKITPIRIWKTTITKHNLDGLIMTEIADFILVIKKAIHDDYSERNKHNKDTTSSQTKHSMSYTHDVQLSIHLQDDTTTNTTIRKKNSTTNGIIHNQTSNLTTTTTTTNTKNKSSSTDTTTTTLIMVLSISTPLGLRPVLELLLQEEIQDDMVRMKRQIDYLTSREIDLCLQNKSLLEQISSLTKHMEEFKKQSKHEQKKMATLVEENTKFLCTEINNLRAELEQYKGVGATTKKQQQLPNGGGGAGGARIIEKNLLNKRKIENPTISSNDKLLGVPAVNLVIAEERGGTAAGTIMDRNKLNSHNHHAVKAHQEEVKEEEKEEDEQQQQKGGVDVDVDGDDERVGGEIPHVIEKRASLVKNVKKIVNTVRHMKHKDEEQQNPYAVNIETREEDIGLGTNLLPNNKFIACGDCMQISKCGYKVAHRGNADAWTTAVIGQKMSKGIYFAEFKTHGKNPNYYMSFGILPTTERKLNDAYIYNLKDGLCLYINNGLAYKYHKESGGGRAFPTHLEHAWEAMSGDGVVKVGILYHGPKKKVYFFIDGVKAKKSIPLCSPSSTQEYNFAVALLVRDESVDLIRLERRS